MEVRREGKKNIEKVKMSRKMTNFVSIDGEYLMAKGSGGKNHPKLKYFSILYLILFKKKNMFLNLIFFLYPQVNCLPKLLDNGIPEYSHIGVKTNNIPPPL